MSKCIFDIVEPRDNNKDSKIWHEKRQPSDCPIPYFVDIVHGLSTRYSDYKRMLKSAKFCQIFRTLETLGFQRLLKDVNRYKITRKCVLASPCGSGKKYKHCCGNR